MLCRVLASRCERRNTVQGGLCVGTRWLWTFSRHLRRVTAAQCWLRGPSFSSQQKGNRCAVMSTVDYSRNIARTKIKRPRSICALSLVDPACLVNQQTDGQSLCSAKAKSSRIETGVSADGGTRRPHPSLRCSTSPASVLLSEHSEVRRPRFYLLSLGGERSRWM